MYKEIVYYELDKEFLELEEKIYSDEKTDKDFKKTIENNRYEKLKEKVYYTFAKTNQCMICNKLIKFDKNKRKFILSNNNEPQTFYKTLEYLVGSNIFKSYTKKMIFKNNKIEPLPNKERIRVQFYLRSQYKTPPLLDNADEIAAFIHAACELTTTNYDYKLSQTWSACKSVVQTEPEAASLFAYYGWAQDLSKDYPNKENMFYKISVNEDKSFHYEIVEDSLVSRFEDIRKRVQDNSDIKDIINNKEMNKKEKIKEINKILNPLLYKKEINDYFCGNYIIRTGLTKETFNLCNDKINKYIENLVERNAFDNFTLEEHIKNIQFDINKLENIEFAKPTIIYIGMNDVEFIDREYNINAKYNQEYAKELGKARSKKAAERNTDNLVGNKWTTQELYALGIDKNKIPRLIKNGIIKRVKKGFYERV